MDFVADAAVLFSSKRPNHFVDYTHCEECAEHDEVLRNSRIDTIGLDELGNPGWDPMCFVDVYGFKYYLPALIRLCVQSNENNYYIDQFLFHITYGATEKQFLESFSDNERNFVATFLHYLVDTKAERIEENMDTDDLFKAIELWGNV